MKGRTFISVANNELFTICDNCWETGARLLHQQAMSELITMGIPPPLEQEGPIKYCGVCKRSQKDIN
jgi:hypothetical protein